jgi:hypothetical protein
MPQEERVPKRRWLIAACSTTASVLLFVFSPSVAATSTVEGACANNLRKIQGAVEQWALENKIASTNAYSLSDTNLLNYMKGGVIKPCDSGGFYRAGKSIADEPSCSIHGTVSALQKMFEREQRRDPVGNVLTTLLIMVGLGGAAWVLGSRASKNSAELVSRRD